MFSILVVVTLRILRLVSDAYTIKRELWADAACQLAGLVLAVFLALNPSLLPRMLIMVVFNIIIFQALTWKVLTSYGINIWNGATTNFRVRWRSSSRSSSSAYFRSKLTLYDLFMHPGGIEAFEGNFMHFMSIHVGPIRATCFYVDIVIYVP